MRCIGLPHSETRGSKGMCPSPRLIAAYRVLHRLVMPRHPSCARIRLAGGSAAPARFSRVTLQCNSSSQTMQLSKIDPARGGEILSDCAGEPLRGLVGVPGIEPGTSSLSGTRSNQLSYTPAGCPARPLPPCSGGGSRIRTGDIQLAKLALYQLSYAPGGRLSRRALKRFRGPRFAVRKGCGRHLLVLAGLMCEASPLSPPAWGVSPSPGVAAGLLLRKEVIQPQVPLRLPCYDFIPITTHTVGGCPLAVGAPPSGADGFHDVTGGVYKARERIHGAVADAPLLANPASRCRVADTDLNWGGFWGLAPPRGLASLCTRHCSTCAAPDVRAILT